MSTIDFRLLAIAPNAPAINLCGVQRQIQEDSGSTCRRRAAEVLAALETKEATANDGRKASGVAEASVEDIRSYSIDEDKTSKRERSRESTDSLFRLKTDFLK